MRAAQIRSVFRPAREAKAQAVGLELRRADALAPEELAQLDRAGLWGLAPAEAWTATGSSADNAYATHGVFRFFGKFPPPVAAFLISCHSRPGELVSDPMCGSGTSGVECLLAGRRGELRDVNPLSLLLARVKTRRVERAKLLAGLERVARRYRPIDDGFEPAGLRDLAHWFLPEALRSLRGLRAAVEAEPAEGVREVFRAVFAASVRRVSKATTQQGRLFLDAASALTDAWPEFFRRAQRVITAVAGLPSSSDRVEVSQHDLRQPFAADLAGRAALVIVHPPYFNAYRYSRINSLELAWLGHSPKLVRPAEVREFFKVGKAENLERYLADMQRAIAHAASLAAPGGRLALMIGDSVLRGAHLPVVRGLLARLDPGLLELERIALRVPRYSEASWVASQRRAGGRLGVALRDYVLVFRRGRGA